MTVSGGSRLGTRGSVFKICWHARASCVKSFGLPRDATAGAAPVPNRNCSTIRRASALSGGISPCRLSNRTFWMSLRCSSLSTSSAPMLAGRCLVLPAVCGVEVRTSPWPTSIVSFLRDRPPPCQSLRRDPRDRLDHGSLLGVGPWGCLISDTRLTRAAMPYGEFYCNITVISLQRPESARGGRRSAQKRRRCYFCHCGLQHRSH
jgi:hypothetical protein